jgi:hypothetical protein
MTDRTYRALRRWADLLDTQFRIPGTGIRFGIDPILSLIPGIGDLASPVFTVFLLLQGVRQRVPKIVLTRMVINALIDAAIGAVPIAGNVGDIFWRANTMNLALLETHAHPGVAPATADYAFVWIIVAIFAALVAVPILIGVWLAVAVVLWLRRPA